MDKKDLEELKEWKEKNVNYIETYGVDIYKKDNKKSKIENIIKIINKIVKILLIVFCILIIIGTGALLVYRWKIVYDLVQSYPQGTFDEMFNVNL